MVGKELVHRLVFWSSKQAKELWLVIHLAMSIVWLSHISAVMTTVSSLVQRKAGPADLQRGH